MKRAKKIFITGTDTGVGKTVATLVLGTLLQEQNFNVGVMKPVQCAGGDAQFLKKYLNLSDPLEFINPYFAPEPLSPHLAFKRQKTKIRTSKILDSCEKLRQNRNVLLVEGAGGLMVPLRENYSTIDLIRDLQAELIIVSRLGLGTINHTLLTIAQAKQAGLLVRGVIFTETERARRGIPEKTNPDVIRRLGSVPVLGTIPYLKDFQPKTILKQCLGKIQLARLLKPSYSRRGSRQFQEADQRYVWHPFTQMKDWLEESPLVIERAQGSYLIDTNGRRYLDGVSSLWVTVHGHGHPAINRAIQQQLNRLEHSTLLGLTHPPAIELAKRLVEIAPRGLKKVFYSDDGSTAVEAGIKIAYQYWQNQGRAEKKHLVHLKNSYHGDTLGSVSAGGIELFRKVYKNLVFKTIETDLENFECVLKEKHKGIAAFLVEPLVQGAAGMIVWPKGILKRMAALCRKHEILLIADEVATGFGRTGRMFACEHEGVSPDILCLAKGLTGGYLPLAATLTTQKIFEGFVFDYKDRKTFFHGHTYTGNPLACAAALANLEVFRKEQTLERLQPKIKFLAKRLRMFYNCLHVGEVRQMGFMAGIELVKDRATHEPFPWDQKIGAKVCQKARERGVILRPLGNVIVLMPPLSISMDKLKTLLDVTSWAVGEVAGDQEDSSKETLELLARPGMLKNIQKARREIKEGKTYSMGEIF